MKGRYEKFLHLLKHQLLHNIASLMGARITRYLLPLISIPYLARVLGAEVWGLVAFAQAFSGFMSLIIEYGFGLSATRELSRVQNKKKAISVITGSVIMAKALLCIGALILSVIIFQFAPLFKGNIIYFYWGVILALVQGNTLIWYFQGIEKLKLAVAVEICFDVLAVASYLFFVSSPSDGWLVLVILSIANMCSFTIHLCLIYNKIPFVLPSLRKVIIIIKKGWGLFLFRSGVSLYTTANPLILGLFVEPRIVGYFVGAEKIIKALSGMLYPVSQAIFPRISSLMQESLLKAKRLLRTSFWMLSAVGLLMSIACFMLAPMLISLILGNDYTASIPVLRIMSIIPFLVAISNVLGIQWLIPLGHEDQFNKLIIFAGVINVILSIILAPLLQHIGMAISITLVECIVTVGVVTQLLYQDNLPFAINTKLKNRSQ